MGEGRAGGGGEENDLFDLWLAHRDDTPGRHGRSSTVPPAWAPAVRSTVEEPAEAAAPVPDPIPEVAAPVVAVVPEPEPEPEPEPVAVVVPEPAPVPVVEVAEVVEAAAPEPEPEPAPEPEPEPAPEPPVDTSFAARMATLVETQADAAEGHQDTGTTDEAPDPERTRADLAPVALEANTDTVIGTVMETADEPDAPARATGRRTHEEPPPPLRHTFSPRTRARTAVGIGTLLAAGAAVIGCYVAAREKDTTSIGIAVTLWVLTGIIWAVHSGTSVTRLSVRGGQLDVLKHGVRTTFDLTSSYTPVEVYGRPGRPGWKVVFRRRDMSGFVIDHTMVDPSDFMRVLRYYRPGVDAAPEAG